MMFICIELFQREMKKKEKQKKRKKAKKKIGRSNTMYLRPCR